MCFIYLLGAVGLLIGIVWLEHMIWTSKATHEFDLVDPDAYESTTGDLAIRCMCIDRRLRCLPSALPAPFLDLDSSDPLSVPGVDDMERDDG